MGQAENAEDPNQQRLLEFQGVIDEKLPGWKIVDIQAIPSPPSDQDDVAAAHEELRARYRNWRSEGLGPANVVQGSVVALRIRPENERGFPLRTVLFSLDTQTLIGMEI